VNKNPIGLYNSDVHKSLESKTNPSLFPEPNQSMQKTDLHTMEKSMENISLLTLKTRTNDERAAQIEIVGRISF